MSRLPASALLIAVALAVAAPSLAQDVIPQRPIKRNFPSGVFCALPVEIEFTSPSTAVVITFTAEVFAPDPGNGGAYTWTEQYVDNVTVATSTLVDANFGPQPGAGEFDCYIDADPNPVSYFFFSNVLANPDLRLLERFDDDPSARGWSFGTGSSFASTQTAPRNVATLSEFTGGSIALGDGSGTPQAGVESLASVLVDNLTASETYKLGAWWNSEFVAPPHDLDYLTISITLPDGTPVAKRSWGQIKTSWK